VLRSPYRPGELAAVPCAEPTRAPRRGGYGKFLALAALAALAILLAVAAYFLLAPPPRDLPQSAAGPQSGIVAPSRTPPSSGADPQAGAVAPSPVPPSSGAAPQGVIGALPVPVAPSSGGSASFPVPPWSLVALVGMVLFYLVLRQLLKQESYEIDASWQIYQVKGKLKLVKVKAAAVKIKAGA